jgi:phosphocarrier protein
MIERNATIRNAHGIHCRPSAMIIKEAASYSGQVTLKSRGAETDLRSILALMAMELSSGQEIHIRVSGPGEKEFCQRLVDLFETNFDFEALSAVGREVALRGL